MIPLRSTEPVHSPATVTISLIVVNILIFIYEAMMGPDQLEAFIMQHGIVPDHLRMSTLVTSMFLHGGWLHVLGNMWFLWIYGRNLEDFMGSPRFFVFYIVCGLAAALVHVFFNPYSTAPTVGASGAIAGVMGGYLVKFPRARIVTLIPVFVFITTLEVPAALLLVYWFFIQAFSGLGSIRDPMAAQRGGVAWFAHVGGFLAGVLLVNLMGARQQRYRSWDWE
jgi:membrane associated rhomboid family serine protease